MKIVQYICMAMALLALTACDDFNEKLDGYDQSDYIPTDVKKGTYELVSDDYAKLASWAGLPDLSKNKYFDSADDAQLAIPMLLSNMYPTADEGSSMRVYYHQLSDESSVLVQLGRAKSYVLKDEDYAAVNPVGYGRYLTKETAAKLPQLLSSLFVDADDSDVVMVHYTLVDMPLQVMPLSDDRSIVDYNRSELYVYEGESGQGRWSVYTSGLTAVEVLPPSVYNHLGVAFVEDAAAVMPVYLRQTHPYAKDGDRVAVVYYYNKYKDVGVVEYVYSKAKWVKIGESGKVDINIVAAPYVLSGREWKYDPSVAIELPAVKKNPSSVAFYQAVTDWVWANIDLPSGVDKGKGYVSKYGDTESYSGASAYSCYVDWSVAAARQQNPSAYESMSDDEVRETLREHLIFTFAKALSALYPDAMPVDGLDVVYTINFTVHDASNVAYTIAYAVEGKGKFAYVDGSLKPAL